MNKELEVLARIVMIKELLFGEINHFFEKEGLNSTEIMIIYTLQHKQKQCKAGDLAAALFLPMSTLTGIVDKMIEKGIVIRERNSEDRRVVMIKLNPEFQNKSKNFMGELVNYMSDISQETSQEWFRDFGEKLEYFENILKKRAEK